MSREKNQTNINQSMSLDFALERGKVIVKKVSSLIEEASIREGSSAFLAAGKIQEIEQNFPVAVRWYERALGVNPDCNEASARIAFVLLKQDKNVKALNIATELTSKAPTFIFKSLMLNHPMSSYTVLGNALIANGHEDGARAAFHRALTIEPGDTFSSGNLGALLLKEGRIEEAASILNNVDPGCGVFAPIAAAARLAVNDPGTLPAVKGMISSIAKEVG